MNSTLSQEMKTAGSFSSSPPSSSSILLRLGLVIAPTSQPAATSAIGDSHGARRTNGGRGEEDTATEDTATATGRGGHGDGGRGEEDTATATGRGGHGAGDGGHGDGHGAKRTRRLP